MSLTKADLRAIQRLIDTSVQASEDRLMTRIDDLDDVLSMQTERGLQEVRDQLATVDGKLSREIAEIKQTVLRIDRVQQAELERNDRQDQAIQHMRKQLHAV